MCNLYSITKNQAAIRDLFKVTKDSAGNLPPLPAVFPDNPAPVVRSFEGERELIMMRWGMPSPPTFGTYPITNIRNTASSHWRRWLGPHNRCLVPATSFSEYNDVANPKSLRNSDGSPHPMAGKKDIVWIALNYERPLFAFAGIWTDWHGTRHKVQSGRRAASRVRLPYDRTERRCRPSACQSDACYFAGR